jgi:hypothetical protein
MPSELQTLWTHNGNVVVDAASIPLRLCFENIDDISHKYWANDSVADKDGGRVQEWYGRIAESGVRLPVYAG